MDISLKIEYVAFLVNIILLFFSVEKNMHLNFRKKCFFACLILSELAILTNIISVVGLGRFSDAGNIFFSSAYYLVIMMNVSMVAYFMFYMMFEHVPECKCSRIANAIILFFLVVVVLLVALNLWTGCLFVIKGEEYTRGSLNAVGYVGVVIELCMIVVCFFRNRKYIDSSLKKLMQIMPATIAALVAIQLVNRDVMMNGMIAAIANILLFIISQSSLREQDTMTGLENRTAFINDVSEKMKKGNTFQIINICLREFSTVNRAFGYMVGDEFLYHVAKYIEHFSQEGKAYRLGGVEFALVIPYTSEEHAKECREKIYHRFFKPWDVQHTGHILKAAVSDLIYQDDGREMEIDQLMEEIQYAQNMVKEKHGTNMIHFDARIRDKMVRRAYLINRMNQAIEEGGFEVYYQPIYNLDTNRFSSAEALLRMRDPETGAMISPGEFIPIAEEVGLIDKIGWVVLDKVCEFIGKHPEIGFKAVSVNMAMSQLMDPRFIEKVMHSIEKHRVPQSVIRIEITERMITENTKKISEVMQELTDMGVYFYLDDFGIGYSNFASVLSLPIDTVKLDYTLVNGAMESKKKYFVLKSLLKMFREAGFSLVAEGIETEEHAKMLMELGADRLQGFYYFRPMPEDKVLATFGRD